MSFDKIIYDITKYYKDSVIVSMISIDIHYRYIKESYEDIVNNYYELGGKSEWVKL